MKKLVFILFSLFLVSKLSAQDNRRQIYLKAEKEYDIGRIENALVLLEDSLKGVMPPLAEHVYRLSGLCYLALEDAQNTEKYARLLLKENPYYTNSQDPRRFLDFIERLKAETTTTVSTASSQAETLEEVPVPIALITEQMIKDCGAQTLQEVLLAYLPSMTLSENNGMTNISYRSFFGVSQEKMLVMINGTRNNSYSTNIGALDYSISLEKIKQIEVLRGPGSTLYGDVALSGVVNIITKRSTDINGVEAVVAAGNYGQKKVAVNFGKDFGGFKMALHAGLYSADGQKYYITKEEQPYATYPVSGDYIVGGVNGQPSYDFGVECQWKNFYISYMTSASKTVKKFSDRETVYDYDKYGRIDGILPGEFMRSGQFLCAYNQKIGKFSFSISGSYYRETLKSYLITLDSIYKGDLYLGGPYYYYFKDYIEQDGEYFALYGSKQFPSGLFSYEKYTADNCRFSSEAVYSYGSRLNGGTLLVGVSYSIFHLTDYQNYLGARFDYLANNYYIDGDAVFLGKEPAAAVYLQFKHRYKNFIVNSGVRYDFKERSWETNAHVFSPRLSFIYMLKHFNAKIGYSKSFVDSPYMKRKLQMTTYEKEELKPEVLHSIQTTLSSDCFVKGLNAEVNIYSYRCKNLVSSVWNATTNVNIDLNTIGVETSVTYERKGWYLNCFASEFSVNDYRYYADETTSEENNYRLYNPVDGKELYYVPRMTAGFTIGYSPWSFLRVSVNTKYYSDHQVHYSYFTETDMPEVKYTLPSVFLVNPSLRLNYKNFGLNFCVSNVFDKEYYQGGSYAYPIRQKGRWWLIGFEAKF